MRDLDGGPAAARLAPGDHLERHRRQRVTSTAGLTLPPWSCSGGHVGGRAEHRVGVGDVGALDGLRDAEIGQLHRPVAAQQDVGRLDVAVDDAGGMGVVERIRDRTHDLHRAARLDRAARQDVGERLTVHVFHDEKHGFVVLVDVEDRDEVLVAQRGAELGLALEAARVDVVALARVHALHGDIAVEPLVVGQVDGRHAARAESLDYSVSAYK